MSESYEPLIPDFGLVQFREAQLMLVRNDQNLPIGEFWSYWTEGEGNHDRAMVAWSHTPLSGHGAHFYSFRMREVADDSGERFVPKVVDNATPESTEDR